ncbi:hypothetical protein KRR38_11920 [Novosphingobium sp. G106]|uniref:hypothetical protein n=1 Tax=Novosphingobium sp. G106 TaxID=2849500 RepID=UPI001C2CFF4B|nr:hypothetical protein [Novosphingobium sp. G106]MBV1688363.1 hypothetical protein [Novosphingobium sp. G106]
MKANRRSAPLTLLALATLSAFTASCSNTRVIPPPTPVPTPTPRPAPPPPPPSRPATQGWQDVPITPGDWTWGIEGGQSVARFAGGTLVLRCDRAASTITLQRSGSAAGIEPLTVTTTSGVRTLSATPQAGALAVALPARDPLLDAIAFSRGRFAVETPGLEPLYVPSWPEVSRVSEDCR